MRKRRALRIRRLFLVHRRLCMRRCMARGRRICRLLMWRATGIGLPVLGVIARLACTRWPRGGVDVTMGGVLACSVIGVCIGDDQHLE
jgi:hypothetical protein